MLNCYSGSNVSRRQQPRVLAVVHLAILVAGSSGCGGEPRGGAGGGSDDPAGVGGQADGPVGPGPTSTTLSASTGWAPCGSELDGPPCADGAPCDPSLENDACLELGPFVCETVSDDCTILEPPRCKTTAYHCDGSGQLACACGGPPQEGELGAGVATSDCALLWGGIFPDSRECATGETFPCGETACEEYFEVCVQTELDGPDGACVSAEELGCTRHGIADCRCLDVDDDQECLVTMGPGSGASWITGRPPE